jgi:hypothetical protein
MRPPAYLVLILSLMPLARNALGAETRFCSQWQQFTSDRKQDFLVFQGQAVLAQGGPRTWLDMKDCFAERVATRIAFIDSVCNAEGAMDFDGGFAVGVLLASLLEECGKPHGQAGTGSKSAPAKRYSSPKLGYEIEYGEAWSLDENPPDRDLDVVLKCNACADPTANIGIGVTGDPTTANVTMAELLPVLKGKGNQITASIRNSPLVRNFELLGEGEAKLGNLRAYEVRSKFEFSTGAKRLRHQFQTTFKGRSYIVVFHTDPERYKTDYPLAKQVMDTFRVH